MQTSQPVEERKGALWDLYRDMKDSQWAVDARSYTTEFRVRPTPELSFSCGSQRSKRPCGAVLAKHRHTSKAPWGGMRR